jgi:hypothetical protein
MEPSDLRTLAKALDSIDVQALALSAVHRVSTVRLKPKDDLAYTRCFILGSDFRIVSQQVIENGG